jgi:hypothetical protein
VLSAPEPAPPSRRRFVLPWEVWFFLLAFVALQFWQGREMQAGAMPPIAGQLADGRPVSLESTLREAGGSRCCCVWSSTCPICRAEEERFRARRGLAGADAGHAVRQRRSRGEIHA